MSNEVIVVRQLPEIEERLQTIKAEVTEKTNYAMSLVCTEETLQAVKNIRAELNREFNGWEDKRKEVKSEIMQPYDLFEARYKDCVSDVYKAADKNLKGKIDEVMDGLKEKRREKIKAYFDEYLASRNIDFVTFENANINITLSASEKSLKEQAKAFIDRVHDDLTLIDTQEHKDEILYEYKQTLNVSAAITTVANRYKAIEEAKKREEERKAKEDAAKAAAEKVDSVTETLAPPKVVEPIAPVSIKKFSIEIMASEEKYKKLIEFLESENYYYECV